MWKRFAFTLTGIAAGFVCTWKMLRQTRLSGGAADAGHITSQWQIAGYSVPSATYIWCGPEYGMMWLHMNSSTHLSTGYGSKDLN